MQYKMKNMCNDKGQQQCPKAKRSIIMMGGGHGGMACMAQKYHGDGDVDGPLHKIGNVGITNVDEHKACYMGKETKGLG
jgi:hypothetical protein